jgi:hypothetical protein
MVAAFSVPDLATGGAVVAPDLAVVVERRVARPFLRADVLGSAVLRGGVPVVPLDGGAILRLDGPLAAVPGTPVATWRATGRIHTGRLRPLARVEVELVAWSEHAADLVVRPATGHLGRWGARRRERYFALAHHAADRLVDVLVLGRVDGLGDRIGG